jgi:hypothetical protein
MMSPTSLLDRPARAAALAATVLAVSASASVALGTAAAADEPGRCTANVNVREEPNVDSRIVALCEAGTAVQVGETRDGFVHLAELGGWSAEQYVAVDGRQPAEPAVPGAEPGSGGAGSGGGDASGADDPTGNSNGTGGPSAPEPGDEEPGSGDEPADRSD